MYTLLERRQLYHKNVLFFTLAAGFSPYPYAKLVPEYSMVHEGGGGFAGFNTPSVLQSQHWNPHLVAQAGMANVPSHLSRLVLECAASCVRTMCVCAIAAGFCLPAVQAIDDSIYFFTNI